MKAIVRILEMAGGFRRDLYLRIENPPYMALVIEATPEPGPCGAPALSIAHYGEQNGDLMRDPEMCSELGMVGGPHLTAFYYRNDYAGVEQWSRFIRDGRYAMHAELHRQHERFAALWDKNLNAQGFVEAFDQQQKQH